VPICCGNPQFGPIVAGDVRASTHPSTQSYKKSNALKTHVDKGWEDGKHSHLDVCEAYIHTYIHNEPLSAFVRTWTRMCRGNLKRGARTVS
jgi:hypothetical protein